MPAPHEKPILMSAPMVRAILDGRKTQTRRVVKPQPTNCEGEPYTGRIFGPEMYEPVAYDKHGEMVPGPEVFGIYDEDGDWGVKCPYGHPGDRLWVRESGWERPERTAKMMREGADTWPRFAYAADDWSDQDRADFKAWGFKARPSIHMPRWASRITLEITGVRVERLQEISVGDCCEEGAPIYDGDEGQTHAVQTWYRELWEQINGPGSWDLNPWVWVVEFRRV